MTRLRNIPGALRRGKESDHRTHGMSDEDRILEADLVANLDHVVRVARESGISVGVVGLQL
jgi:hypothetical protein